MRSLTALITFCLLLTALPLYAQEAAPSTQPKYVIAAGGGFDGYSTPRTSFGWGGLGIRVAENVYSYSSLILGREKATTLTGIAVQIWREEWVRIYAFGQAGAETGEGTVQGAYSAGGFVVIPIGKLFGAPSIGLMPGVKIAKPVGDTSDPSVVKPVFLIGLTWSSKAG